MDMRHKQWADAVLGKPLVAFLYPWTRLLSAVFPRENRTAGLKHVTFVKMLGGGSLLFIVPTVLELRRTRPGLKISCVCSSETVKFAEAYQVFDEIIVINDRSWPALLFSGLRALWFLMRSTDCVVDLEIHSRLTTVMTVCSFARCRIGFTHISFQSRQRLYTHAIYYNLWAPLFSFYDGIAAIFQLQGLDRDADRPHLQRVIEGPGAQEVPAGDGPLITLGTGCSKLSTERALSLEQWDSILKLLSAWKPGARLVALGGAADGAFVQELQRRHPRLENLCGRLTLHDSWRALRSSELFVGIDSMLIHMARLFSPQVLGFWGATDPRTLLRPRAVKEKHLYLGLLCSPCVHIADPPPCRGDNQCMKLHRLDDLAGVLRELSSQTFLAAREPAHRAVWVASADSEKPEFVG